MGKKVVKRKAVKLAPEDGGPGTLPEDETGGKDALSSSEGKEEGWLDSNILVVEETHQEDVVKDWGEADLVSFQASEKVDLWDMSSVVSEVDREEEKGVITYDNVKVVGVDGVHEVDFDGTFRYDEEKEFVEDGSEEEFLDMEKRKNDEIKRNRNEYLMYCPDCRNDLRCRNCRGKGRSGILRRKCKVCGGSGRCRTCSGEFEVPCTKCSETISGYSTSCRHCGMTFRCPKCLQPLPLMATRCISCKKKFFCKLCKERIPVGSYTKCQKCGKEM